MSYTTVLEVNRVFGGIVCPHCKEPVHIFEQGEDPIREFIDFMSNNPKAEPECIEFNGVLNVMLEGLRDGLLTEAQVAQKCSQYKP